MITNHRSKTLQFTGCNRSKAEGQRSTLVKVAGAPAMLGVIVATGVGYLRPDGIAVIPIGALGP